MKKIIILLLVALAVPFTAMSQNSKTNADFDSIYKKFSKQKGVTTVRLTPSMLGMIGNGTDLEKVKSMSIITTDGTENSEATTSLINVTRLFIKENKYELLMDVNSGDGEAVEIHGSGTNGKFNTMMMIVDGGDEKVVIYFDGKDLDLNMINNLKKSQNL